MEDSPTCPGTEELLDVSSQCSQATKNMDLTVLPLALVANYTLECVSLHCCERAFDPWRFMVTHFQYTVLGVGVGS